MCEGFIEKIKVLDEWGRAGESYRLVYKGAGPLELQILKANHWEPERSSYVWGVITSRLLALKKLTSNVIQKDFTKNIHSSMRTGTIFSGMPNHNERLAKSEQKVCCHDCRHYVFGCCEYIGRYHKPCSDFEGL